MQTFLQVFAWDNALCCAGWCLSLLSSFLFGIHSKLEFGCDKTRLEENKPIMFRDTDHFLVKFVKSLACDSTKTGLHYEWFSADFPKLSVSMILRTPTCIFFFREHILRLLMMCLYFGQMLYFTKISNKNYNKNYHHTIINSGRNHTKWF